MAKTKKPLKTALLVVILLAFAAIAGYALFQPTPAPKPLIVQPTDSTPVAIPTRPPEDMAPPLLSEGSAAPDFTMPDLNGKPVSLRDYHGKQWVLVEFMSPKCPHCQISTAFLDTLYGAEKDRLEILSVNAGDRPEEPSTSKGFQQQYHIPYPILEHPEMSTTTAYKLSGFPTFYLVDPSGVIRWAHTGQMSNEHVTALQKLIHG
ncbi:MAG: redoxin domain-containing protein [Candidatus Melainabacteria bacterium]